MRLYCQLGTLIYFACPPLFINELSAQYLNFVVIMMKKYYDMSKVQNYIIKSAYYKPSAPSYLPSSKSSMMLTAEIYLRQSRASGATLAAGTTTTKTLQKLSTHTANSSAGTYSQRCKFASTSSRRPGTKPRFRKKSSLSWSSSGITRVSWKKLKT